MKKFLLLGLIASTTFTNAQVLESENFNSLTVDNVGTSILGDTPGQGGFYTLASVGETSTTTNASNANFKIIASPIGSTRGNLFSLTGSNGNAAANYMFKVGLDNVWATRAEGNNMLEFTVEINPGARATVSTNTFGVTIYDETYATLGGFYILSQSGQLIGQSSNGGYSLTDAIIPASAFTKITVAYDSATADVYVRVGDSENYFKLPGKTIAAPFEIDFETNNSSATNAAAHTVTFDNYVATAKAEAFLGVKRDAVAIENGLTVYPNPATNVLNISMENITINRISVVDLNGRTVKNADVNNLSTTQLNISDLVSGMYFINVTTDNGTISKKIIKN